MRSMAKEHGRGAFLFSLVGVLNTATDFAVYAAGVYLGVFPLLANVIAFIAANIQSYWVNAVVTFRRDGRAAKMSVRGYFRFAAAHLFGLAISTGFILAFSSAVGPLPAKLGAVAFSVASNYVLSALFVFRRHERPDAGPGPA